MKHARAACGLIVAVAAICTSITGCASPCGDRIDVVRRFNESRDRGDLDSAKAMITPGARVWYENPTGQGSPWRPGEGAWAGWDAFFRGTKRIVGDYQCDGDAVWAVVDETNDYYRLTERTWSRTMLTWYVTDDARIRGFFVAGVGQSASRAGEFEAWVKEHHPAEYAYLYPGGRLDPSGDRPQRIRSLLISWRASVGLVPIDLGPGPPATSP